MWCSTFPHLLPVVVQLHLRGATSTSLQKSYDNTQKKREHVRIYLDAQLPRERHVKQKITGGR